MPNKTKITIAHDQPKKKKPSLTDLSNMINEDVDIPEVSSNTKSTSPGRLMEFSSLKDELDIRIDGLESKIKNAQLKSGRAHISHFHKVPGRQRDLSPEEISDLKNNMTSIGTLITPLTVDIRPDGDFEIVAGNNRYDIALELGWSELDYFVFSGDKALSNASAFYSNLLHPSLSDYEKYKGIKGRMLEANLTQAEVAKESGLSSSIISRLMSFDSLPEECLGLLEKNNKLISLTSATRLVQLLNTNGGNEKVIKAVSDLHKNPELTQDQAIEKASLNEKPKITTQKLTPYIVKDGKKKFAEIRSVNNNIRITLTNEDDRIEITKKINELVENFIKDRK